MLVSDYNYDLPEERIAKFPPKERGTTRLLVLDKKTGKTTDSHYADLDEFLNPGDLLMLNDTRVMQSRLFCTLPDGRKRELVVLEKHGNEVDYVITHEPPASVKDCLGVDVFERIEVHALFEEIIKSCTYQKWFFGKCHIDKNIPVKFYAVFNNVTPLK